MLRVFASLLALAAIGFNAALMLSDRAPGLLERVFGGPARRLFARIDAGTRLAADPRLPQSDAIVHIVVWAAAVGLVGLALWTWRGLVGASVLILSLSLVLEILQGRFSDSRSVERTDAVANAIGVGAGAVAAATCYLAYSTLAVAFGRR